MASAFRLISRGTVSGLRSQTTWHAIAEAMRPGDPPVLALMRPAEAYVSIGYHVPIEALDAGSCRRRGLAVYRRRAGGGPVLCDARQLFFQVIVPAGEVPGRRDRAWERYLGPAVEAFRALGADARLAGGNDIAAGDVKLSGTGAAEIGDAVVFVGNVIFGFDHAAMAGVLALPVAARGEVERLMRRVLVPLPELLGRPVAPEEAEAAIAGAYAAALGPAEPSEPTPAEHEACARLDRLFTDPAWVGAPRGPRRPGVKIRAGAGVVVAGDAVVTLVDGRIERVLPGDGWVAAPGMGAELARALEGLPPDPARLAEAIRGHGEPAWADAFVRAVVDAHRGWS